MWLKKMPFPHVQRMSATCAWYIWIAWPGPGPRPSGKRIWSDWPLTYKIMGDPTRLRIILALRGGEMCVCDIAAFLGLSESAVSHQLRRLRELALVSSRRDGQILYYSLDDAHVMDLVSVGLDPHWGIVTG